jgi:transcription elongation factor GreA
MKLQDRINDKVSLGSTVHIRDMETNEREMYALTKPSDADIRRNRISSLSPIARALYGQRPGDIVEVQAPGGIFLVEIEAVHATPELQYARDG